MSSDYDRALTPEQADAVFTILVEHAGAHPDDRAEFLYHETKDGGCTEFRFQGSLGFGGKFYVNADRWYVGAYREDMTPDRAEVIERVNGLLAGLREGAMTQ